MSATKPWRANLAKLRRFLVHPATLLVIAGLATLWLASRGWERSLPVSASSLTFHGFVGDTPSLIDPEAITEVKVSGLAKPLEGCLHSEGDVLILPGTGQKPQLVSHLVPFRNVTGPCEVAIQGKGTQVSMNVDCTGTVTTMSLASEFAEQVCRDDLAARKDVTRRLDVAASGSIGVTYASTVTPEGLARIIFDGAMAVEELSFTLVEGMKVGTCEVHRGAKLRVENSPVGTVKLRRMAFGKNGLDAAVELRGARRVRLDDCDAGEYDVPFLKVLAALAGAVGSVVTFAVKYGKLVKNRIKACCLRARRKRRRKKNT